MTEAQIPFQQPRVQIPSHLMGVPPPPIPKALVSSIPPPPTRATPNSGSPLAAHPHDKEAKNADYVAEGAARSSAARIDRVHARAGNARSLLDEVEQREDADAPALVADTIPAPPESESAPDAVSSAQLLQILQFDMHHKSDKD